MFVFSLIAAAFVGQDAPLLLEKSKVITSTSGWSEVSQGVADYRWVDANTIIYLKKAHGARLSLLNVKTRASVDAACGELFETTVGIFETLQVSPDGQRILWAGKEDSQGKWFVAKVADTVAQNFPRKRDRQKASAPSDDDYSTLAWSNDGKSVLECEVLFGSIGSTMLWKRSLVDLQHESLLPVADGYVDWQPTIVAPYLVCAPAGIAIGGQRNSMKFITWNPIKPKATRHEWAIKAPKNRTIAGYSHSHSGKHVLWDLSIHDAKHPGPWDSAGEELWVTDLHGKNWKQLARMPFDGKDADAKRDSFGFPKWLPGDQAISFSYMDKLYICPLAKL